MNFDANFLGNCVYNDQAIMFNPLLPEGGKMDKSDLTAPRTGALVQPNGDILFRIYAPNAATVEVAVQGPHPVPHGCTLTKGEDGMFEGIYPYEAEYAGPHSIDIIVDGAVLIYPHIPIMWHRNKPVNFIEVPDPEATFININKVPHGAISREIYWSESFGTWQRCMVYTPPGYQKSGEDYPVLYLQHGSTENETCWEYNGRVGYIMDNLIAEGKCLPFIIVMNDGMARTPADLEPGAYKFEGFERSLIESCIPYIDATYRTKSDKWHRAFAGLSMGASQALHFGIRHPEVFGAFAMFSAPLHRPGNEPYLLEKVMDAKFMEENYKLFMRTVGDCETMQYKSFVEYEEKLKECGTGLLPLYHSAVYHNQYHEFGCWRRAIRDFAQLAFRW